MPRAFDALSIGPTGVEHWERATKYMVPATPASRIPALVQNAKRYSVHMDFIEDQFLPGLDLPTYTRLVMARATREYFAGNLVRIQDPSQGSLYGFTVYASAKVSEALEPVEVRRIYDALRTLVAVPDRPLVFTFEPFDALGAERAKAWISPGFPIWFAKQDGVTVEIYTPGTNYGRVRRFTVEEFDALAAAGNLGYRDLVVVDSVPFDLEPIVAGVITGGRQWELSHVNVRMARRGTPNLFVADAFNALAAWEGRLVRLDAVKRTSEAEADRYALVEATHRPTRTRGGPRTGRGWRARRWWTAPFSGWTRSPRWTWTTRLRPS
jgi:hypothetical protein